MRLSADDFEELGPQVEPITKQFGSVRLLIDASALKGWNDIATFEKHAEFVKAHQQKVDRIAVIAAHEWQHWLVTGSGETECNDDELDKQTAAINATYKMVMISIADPAKKIALRDSEREWIKARDKKCNHAGDDVIGGSQQGAEVSACNVSETEKRILYLRGLVPAH